MFKKKSLAEKAWDAIDDRGTTFAVGVGGAAAALAVITVGASAVANAIRRQES